MVSGHSEPAVISRLEILNVTNGDRKLVHEETVRFEAPNWSPDGRQLLYNQQGNIYTIPTAGGTPERLPLGFANRCNNDHGISPDGKTLAISHHEKETDLSKIYIVSILGGSPQLVTPLGPSYWHGWSPDGSQVVYCAARNDQYDIYIKSLDQSPERQLTNTPGLDDGPEFSPDGEFVYFNSVRTGAMKIWRMRPDGTEQEQLTFDDYNDWFAHPSPDGSQLVFISYISEIDPTSHPPYKEVMLRLMPAVGGRPKELLRLFGGQGTINVPSWSPDGTHIAFVSYELL